MVLFIPFLIIRAQDWIQVGSDIDGENEDDQFGCSVSLNRTGSIVAIGAFSNDDNGLGSGQARVYRYNNDNWIQIGDDIDGDTIDDQFGEAISSQNLSNISISPKVT